MKLGMKSLSVSKGFALFKMIKNVFIIIAVLGIVFNVIGLWNEHQQLEPILEELGGKLFNPIYNLWESGAEIRDTGFWVNSGHIFKDIGTFFFNIYSLLEPIIFIYLTMYYIFLFAKHVLVGDSSRNFNAIMISLVIYLLLQFLYIKSFTDLPLKTPFTAIGNLFGLLKIVFS